MKLVKLNCPNCNAKLEVNEEMKQFTCNYCGATSLLDDEVNRVEVKGNVTNTEYDNDLANLLNSKNYKTSKVFVKEAYSFVKKYPKSSEGMFIFLDCLYDDFELYSWYVRFGKTGKVKRIYDNFLDSNFSENKKKSIINKHNKIMETIAIENKIRDISYYIPKTTDENRKDKKNNYKNIINKRIRTIFFSLIYLIICLIANNYILRDFHHDLLVSLTIFDVTFLLLICFSIYMIFYMNSLKHKDPDILEKNKWFLFLFRDDLKKIYIKDKN